MYKIERKYAPFWFFDAIRQFEEFEKVKCPTCGNEYNAEEAKLFFFFKSPYVVVLLCLIFLCIALFVNFKLMS
jgi:uncharacterized protein (DUF983 family)